MVVKIAPAITHTPARAVKTPKTAPPAPAFNLLYLINSPWLSIDIEHIFYNILL